MKNRNKQLNKEAILTVGLYIFYFIWWYYFAYMYPIEKKYIPILGLPAWFFYSCVVGLIIISISVFLLVKFFFKDIDLN